MDGRVKSSGLLPSKKKNITFTVPCVIFWWVRGGKAVLCRLQPELILSHVYFAAYGCLLQTFDAIFAPFVYPLVLHWLWRSQQLTIHFRPPQVCSGDLVVSSDMDQ